MVRNVKNLRSLTDRLKTYRWPALILALGVLLLLVPQSGKSTAGAQTEDESISGETFSLDAFSRQLEALLGRIQGAGQVHLLLSLQDQGETSYQTNLSESQGQDTAQTQRETVLARQNGDDSPVVVSSQLPQFRGAVVVCQGADQPGVVLALKEAVASLTGLGMDHITVLKMD